MAGNVILGYDGSEGSKAALKVAVRAAHAFEAGLVVIFGYEPTPTSGESTDYRNEIHRIGDEAVAEAAAEAQTLDSSVAVEQLVVPMKAVDALLEAAEEREAIAIVVGGSSSSGPIVGAILGSVPYKLLHRATVPVLVVPVRPD
jgi:nucleotide-binding universal stress UspA family protein